MGQWTWPQGSRYEPERLSHTELVVSHVDGDPDHLSALGTALNVLVSQGGSSVVEIGASGGVVEIGGSGGMVEIGGQSAPAGGGAAGQGAQASAAQAAAGSVEATERADHFARAQFADASGRPLSGAHYAYTDASGEETESALRTGGEIRRARMQRAGQQEAALFGLGAAEWSASEARVGEAVTASCEAYGYEDGTEAKVLVYRRSGGSDDIVAEIEAEVSGGRVEAEWMYGERSQEEAVVEEENSPQNTEGRTYGVGKKPPAEEDNGETRGGGVAGDGFPWQRGTPVYFAKVHVYPQNAPAMSETGALTLLGRLEFDVKDRHGSFLKNTNYQLRLADGSVREGTTDGQGRLCEEDLPAAPSGLTVIPSGSQNSGDGRSGDGRAS